MSENCEVMVIFSIFGQFGAVLRPASGHRSSNINEVIRSVLNFLLFFYNKISQVQKSTKRIKALKAPKSTKAQPI